MGRNNFPVPAFTINGGRTKVWELEAIRAYEKLYPDPTDGDPKRFKTNGYFLAVQKGSAIDGGA